MVRTLSLVVVALRLLVPGGQHPHILCIPISIMGSDRIAGCHERIPMNMKEFAMTPKFLREEAARFRGMAETADREASKQRYLMMATDFEARAQAADDTTEPDPGKAVTVKVGERIAKEMKARIQGE